MSFDMSSFDRSISEIQRKLSSLQTPANIAVTNAQNAARANQLGAGVSGPTRAAQERATIQYRKELDSSMRIENTTAEKLAVLYGRKYQQFEGLVKQQKQLAAGSAEEIINLQKQEGVKRSLGKLENGIVEAQNRGNQAATAKQALQEKEMEKTMKIAKIFGGVGAAALFIAKSGEYLAGAPMRLEQAQATAIQKTYGMDLGAVYAGKTLEETAFLPERGKAKGMAAEKAQSQRSWDAIKGAGGVALIAGAAVAALLAIPSGGLSVAGYAGALTTAGVGGSLLIPDQTRERFMGLFSPEHQAKYEKLLAAQQAEDYRSLLTTMKEKDPGKQMAILDFEKNFQRNVGVQRQLGIGTEEMYGKGGLLQGAQQFMPQQVIDMANQIIGAGGSTGMGRQANFGLQMQRAGMTNASQIMGAVSGGMQDPESAKRAIITAMAEGLHKGLNMKEFAEEMRRFTQAIGSIVGRVGAETPESQDRIAGNFGMFLGQKTVAGVETAKSEYEKFQQRGSELGGRRGVMRFAEARRDPNLGKLNTMELTELLAMRPEELESNPALLAYFTEKAGFKNPEELLQKMGQMQKDTRYQIPAVREMAANATSIINKYRTDPKHKMGITDVLTRAMTPGGGGLPQSVVSAVGALGLAGNIEEQGGMTKREMLSREGEQLRLPGEKLTAKDMAAMDKMVKESKTGRVEDDYITALGKSASLTTQAFKDLLPAIHEAIGEMYRFSGKTMKEAERDRQGRNALHSEPLSFQAWRQQQSKAHTSKKKG
jgi:hypothetical protein